MSYISTIGPLEIAASHTRTRDVRGIARPRRPAAGILSAIGGVLSSVVEGAVFLTIMGGLSLMFCGLVAGI